MAWGRQQRHLTTQSNPTPAPLSESHPCLLAPSCRFDAFLASGNPLPHYAVILLLPFLFQSPHFPWLPSMTPLCSSPSISPGLCCSGGSPQEPGSSFQLPAAALRPQTLGHWEPKGSHRGAQHASQSEPLDRSLHAAPALSCFRKLSPKFRPRGSQTGNSL